MAAPGPWLFTNTILKKLLDGTLDLDSNSFKVALFRSTSNIGPVSTTYAGLTGEVQQNFGYLTGGVAVTLALTGTTTVITDFSSNPLWTADGGNIVARYAAIYKISSGEILCYCLLDSAPADYTVFDGADLVVNPPAGGIFSLAAA